MKNIILAALALAGAAAVPAQAAERDITKAIRARGPTALQRLNRRLDTGQPGQLKEGGSS